jgi:quercetin dioxygenase-like cupin family protein
LINPLAQFIHHAPGQGRTFSAVGDKYTFLATGEQTGGAYFLADAVVPPGGGPPPHIHSREDESFYVLEGEVTFTVDGRDTVALAGTFVQAPRNIPHAFKNNTSTAARMLILCVPAGFEKFMVEFATELPSRNAPAVTPTEEDIEKLIRLAPQYGITLLPPAH